MRPKKFGCSSTAIEKLRPTIGRVIAFAHRDKVADYNLLVMEAKEVFKESGFIYNDETFTYTDDIGRVYDVNDIRSRTHMRRYESMCNSRKEVLSDLVNRLQDKRGKLYTLVGPHAVDMVIENLKEACYEREMFIREHGDITSEIVGHYQSARDKYAAYIISKNPIDIFMKSTARSWQVENCERHGGSSEKGIYSDIAHNSCVIYIEDIRTKKILARMNLRVCIVNPYASELKEKYSLGYDIYWYRGDHSHARYNITDNKAFHPLSLTAKKATAEIVDLLIASGFNQSYIKCTTPYVHAGYSDVEYKKGTTIEYTTKWTNCKNCGKVIKADNRNQDYCKECKPSNRFRCRNCGGTFREEDFDINNDLCNDCANRDDDDENNDDEH